MRRLGRCDWPYMTVKGKLAWEHFFSCSWSVDNEANGTDGAFGGGGDAEIGLSGSRLSQNLIITCLRMLIVSENMVSWALLVDNLDASMVVSSLKCAMNLVARCCRSVTSVRSLDRAACETTFTALLKKPDFILSNKS